jgi:pimeloyl-ACP methyl ester carboxylesterase
MSGKVHSMGRANATRLAAMGPEPLPLRWRALVLAGQRPPKQ